MNEPTNRMKHSLGREPRDVLESIVHSLKRRLDSLLQQAKDDNLEAPEVALKLVELLEAAIPDFNECRDFDRYDDLLFIYESALVFVRELKDEIRVLKLAGNDVRIREHMRNKLVSDEEAPFFEQYFDSVLESDLVALVGAFPGDKTSEKPSLWLKRILGLPHRLSEHKVKRRLGEARARLTGQNNSEEDRDGGSSSEEDGSR